MKFVSDKTILELWKSPLFSGSFSGIRNFQAILKLEKNIDVSRSRLHDVLSQEPIFLYHQRKHQNFQRRFYDLNVYGELVQCDLAHMFPYDGYKYILVLIDCFSTKLFAKALKSKKAPVVARSLEELLKKLKTQVHVLESDRGKEFVSSEAKKVYERNNIFYKAKFGRNKAAFVERFIYILKRKLYMLLRSKLSENWVKFLPNVVASLNRVPRKRLGFLRPIDISNEASSVAVSQAKEKLSIATLRQPNIFQQKKNEKADSLNKTSLKKDDYVYKQFDVKMFDKKYNIAVTVFRTKSCFK